MATEAKPASPKYAVGERVEVRVFDSKTTGLSDAWTSGTITAVDLMDNGRWSVVVTRDNGRPPVRHGVAKRGKSKYIRAF